MPWLRSLVAHLLITTVAAAGDWPQWLGPNRDAFSPEKVAPWKEAPKAAWRQAVGEGHSSPVVAGGRVYLFTKVRDKDEEELTCFDAKSGERQWSKSHTRAPFQSEFGNGPRGSPTVSGGKVYTFGVTGVLSCFDAAKGDLVWRVDTQKDFTPPALRFGASCSPLVADGKVFVNVGAKGASVVAFDKDQGSVVWKALDDPASYSSPIRLGNGKNSPVVFLTAQGVVCLDAADGSVFWKFPLVDLLSESSTTPVRVGDRLVASSVTFGSVGLKLEEKNSKPAATQAWKQGGLTCYFATPVAVGTDNVYLVTGSILPPPQAVLRCVEAKSGKQLWSKGKVGTYHASLLRTGDNKLLMLEEPGNLVLIDPDPKEYRELARAKVCGQSWAHPALADGRLYVRDSRQLICLPLEGAEETK